MDALLIGLAIGFFILSVWLLKALAHL